MSDTILDGGIHLNVEIRLDAEQIAGMPPQAIAALMRGVADILTAKEYAAPRRAVPDAYASVADLRGVPAANAPTSSEGEAHE